MNLAALICLLSAIVLVVCEWRCQRIGMAMAKCTASSAFVLAAWFAGAADSDYGRPLLVAFALSWIGDICLLAHARAWFLAGIGAFLLAHVAFSVAFAALPLDRTTLFCAAAGMLIFGLLMLRWLWPHLVLPFRFAVTAYVIAIAAMVTTALAATAAGAPWPMAAGALAFALSDISVARDRFVAPGIGNRVWGLPLYYLAQLLLVASLRAAG